MRLFFAAVLSLFSLVASATSTLDYFPKDITFNPEIPTPGSVLGYPVGKWHVRHDQLVYYMRLLAEKSDRISIETIGYTHQQRPLVQLVVSRPDKLSRVQQIRERHINALSSNTSPAEDAELIMLMGYSVHGNEPSGANAALLFAYYLAAAQGEEIERYLDQMVIIVDPSLNPDGLNRFAYWVNSHKGVSENSDDNHRLHNEMWPGGRTNHYWFDLNRDWLLLVHPESQARIERFHQWKPHVVTDYHEMGRNSTYFFQPGIPSRKNPMTPVRNVELTKAIAQYHAQSFDSQNVLYFTEESYDDFYAGKGSTYPDLNGSIGILFEQASARGFKRETVNGVLRFETAIKNQLTASLSTLKGSLANKRALMEHQSQFYQDYKKLSGKDEISGFILSESHDEARFNALLRLLKAHQINAYPLVKDIKANNKLFDKEHSYFVPLAQPQYRLIHSIFSRQKSFDDNTFYDVSNWNLAWSFNIDFEPITSNWGLKYGSTPWQEPAPVRMMNLKDAYAYAFSWDEENAAVLLQYLLDNGIEVRAATKAFTATTDGGARRFAPGAIVVNKGLQTLDNWLEILRSGRDKTRVSVVAIHSGLSNNGIDLGSRSMHKVTKPRVLLLGGRGVSSTEVGEIWHYLDTVLGVAPSIVELSQLSRVKLADYSHIIMADGRYNKLGDKQIEKINRWVRDGGIIWGQKNAVEFLAEQEILKVDYSSEKEMAKRFDKGERNYGDKQSVDGQKRIAGAVFSVELDLSHPLAFGYHSKHLPVFKNSTLVLQKSSRPFITVGRYSKFPQLGGYAAQENVDRIAQSSFMIAHSHGRGLVIGIADNVNFRGIWQGTRRLLSNSLYFGSVVEASVD